MINELLKDKDRDTEFLVIAALRYCIGRRTYAPSLVTDWVMRHWPKFSDNLKAIVRQDMKAEIAIWERCSSLGDPCDVKTWTYFLQWIEESK